MADYILIHASDPPFTVLAGDKLVEFLADPEGFAGVTSFVQAGYLGANPDPNAWPEGRGLLLKVEAVVPRPAGRYVLP